MCNLITNPNYSCQEPMREYLKEKGYENPEKILVAMLDTMG
jgi:hypothetical protein